MSQGIFLAGKPIQQDRSSINVMSSFLSDKKQTYLKGACQPRTRERGSWLYVGIWTSIIYAAIPLARTIQKFIAGHIGRQFFIFVTLATVFAALSAIIVFHQRHRGVLTKQNGFWLGGVAIACVYWTFKLKSSPEESLHFIEYGLLSFLVFRALSHRVRDILIYFISVGICAIIGTVDEVIQWLTPQRSWAFRDIGLNIFSAGLVQIAIWKGLPFLHIKEAISKTSIQWASRVWMAMLFLLGLCASNTPQNLDWCATHVPFLRFVKLSREVMAEYGYRHIDAEIGIFYSRFSLKELARLDQEGAADNARILDRYRSHEIYPEFLEIYTAASHPFLHEARVHLFRRDVYLSRGLALQDHDEDDAMEIFHVAWSENRIMQKYFPQTLQYSHMDLAPETINLSQAKNMSGRVYESAVSNTVITSYSMGQIWLSLWMTIIILFSLEYWLVRKLRA